MRRSLGGSEHSDTAKNLANITILQSAETPILYVMLKANNMEMRMKNLLLNISCNSQSQPVQKQKEGLKKGEGLGGKFLI